MRFGLTDEYWTERAAAMLSDYALSAQIAQTYKAGDEVRMAAAVRELKLRGLKLREEHVAEMEEWAIRDGYDISDDIDRSFTLGAYLDAEGLRP